MQQQQVPQTHQDLCATYLHMDPEHRPGVKDYTQDSSEGLKGPRVTTGRVESEERGREPEVGK